MCHLLLVKTGERWLMVERGMGGPPISGPTTQVLAWGSNRVGALGKQALRLGWDQASWHDSQAVRTALRRHNRQGTQRGGGVRLVPCRLPRSPGLTPIEPTSGARQTRGGGAASCTDRAGSDRKGLGVWGKCAESPSGNVRERGVRRH